MQPETQLAVAFLGEAHASGAGAERGLRAVEAFHCCGSFSQAQAHSDASTQQLPQNWVPAHLPRHCHPLTPHLQLHRRPLARQVQEGRWVGLRLCGMQG